MLVSGLSHAACRARCFATKLSSFYPVDGCCCSWEGEKLQIPLRSGYMNVYLTDNVVDKWPVLRDDFVFPILLYDDTSALLG